MFETVEAILALIGLAVIYPILSGQLVWKRDYDHERGKDALKASGVVVPTHKDYLEDYQRDPVAFSRETTEWKPGDGFSETYKRVRHRAAERAKHHAWLERTGYRKWLEALINRRRKLGHPLSRDELIAELQSELARNTDAQEWLKGRPPK